MRVCVQVTAETEGSLSLRHFESGERVAKGDPIGEVEAFKMLYPIEAPARGILFWLVPLGAVIGEGDLLAEIETEGDGA